MRCAYFDCFSGAAGDMILGALLDAGAPLATLQDAVARLALSGVTLHAERVQRHGLAATLVEVRASQPASHHRHLPDILAIIARSGLPDAVTALAGRVFERLAQAEAAVHGIAVERVHFHEVGAVDAIVDVVGACAGLHALGVERIACSPIPTGHGTVHCAHGELPVPAPATAQLLRGVPLAACDVAAELTTPTGAAILTTVAAEFGALPPLRLEAVGCGAGQRELPGRANILRLLVGTLDDAGRAVAGAREAVVQLETQLDDIPGQTVAYAAERLLEAGALDVTVVPIMMKKGRPGQLLTVLCRPVDVERLEALVFAETTTLGVRRVACERTVLARSEEPVATAYGPIRVKVGRGPQVLRARPEYEDCAAAARKAGVPLAVVLAAARDAWMESHGERTASGDGQ